ncbi:MAG: Hint domain-containing protein, partial [Phycisphaerales bacterium]|nr:Hint domain-containing protein [Phycisphaerales bacterium]
LGRLARKETPIAIGSTEARREDYRYDGVRRIQEAVTRWSGAVVIPGGEDEGGNFAGGTNPGEPGEGDPGAITLGGLEEPVEATELEPFGEGTLLLALPEEWDQREYVWGPDYVDELAFQFDKNGRPLYALLDANYNVMAIVAGGVRPCGNIDADPYDDSVPAGTVLEQYVWSPYGELLAKDTLIPPATGESPRNRVGHQGLIFERFDGLNTDPPLVATDPITGEGKGWYYNRNRWYDATMGRFTTADPNETAMVALSSMAMNASTFDVMLGAADLHGQYGDGMNLFAYGGSSPLRGGDPTGLNWWDDDIDDAIADRTGHALFSMGALNEGARWASIGLNTALNLASGFLPGSGLYDALQSAKGFFTTGQGGFTAALDVAAALLPGIGAAKRAAGIMMDGRMAFRGLGGAFRWGGAAMRACNRVTCFAPGTMIDTPDGPVPIEWLRKNDWVLSRHESDPAGRLIPRRVSEVFQSSTSSVVWITLENGVTLGVTPEHPMWESSRAGLSACELLVGDRLTTNDGSSLAIVEVLIDATPVTVFNLEIAGTYTYFAEGAWVHNCKAVWHHTVPNQILNKLHPGVAKAVERQKIQFKMPEDVHKQLHGKLGDGYRWSHGPFNPRGGGFNARWRAELHSLGKPLLQVTVDEVMDIQRRIVADYGLDLYKTRR